MRPLLRRNMWSALEVHACKRRTHAGVIGSVRASRVDQVLNRPQQIASISSNEKQESTRWANNPASNPSNPVPLLAVHSVHPASSRDGAVRY
jgi:hypothetical protein